MSGNFSLFPDADGRFAMKRDGEDGLSHFASFHEAFRYARSCPDIENAKVILYDVFGTETIRFSVTIPGSQQSVRMASLNELAALARRVIEKKGSFHVSQNWLWRCWDLNLSRNTKQRRDEIEAFAQENKWSVDMRYEPYGLSVDFKNVKSECSANR